MDYCNWYYWTVVKLEEVFSFEKFPLRKSIGHCYHLTLLLLNQIESNDQKRPNADNSITWWLFASFKALVKLVLNKIEWNWYQKCQHKIYESFLLVLLNLQINTYPYFNLFQSEVVTGLESLSDLSSKISFSISSAFTEIILMDEFKSEKRLFEFTVPEKQNQHVCRSQSFKDASGPEELKAILFEQCGRSIGK